MMSKKGSTVARSNIFSKRERSPTRHWQCAMVVGFISSMAIID
ncbi:hypothetical protein CSIRO_0135 [Bradyrhizobiaceae bacterium SG-6C]|nr:hypothetical protein CSIRO_0135 [Bradyrhizobiaceae bacterium SG-6C]